jgi:hypothetical protein
MMDYILVDEKNCVIDRTKGYASEKKWYTFKSLRPQKAALKAYNSICYHNANFKKNLENYTNLNLDENMEKDVLNLHLQKFIQPNCKSNFEFDQNLKNEYINKILELDKITKPLFIYIRKISTNKIFGYYIKSILNLRPNYHEMKNKIIIKTKATKISNISDQIGLTPQDYIMFL